MSFWRHEEIYRSDVGLGKAGNGNGCRRSPRSSAAMSFQSAIPRQGALQQSLPPLHRLETILNNQCCRTMTGSGQQSSVATRLAAYENTGFFLGMVKPQPGDISIVENAGTFLMWYDTRRRGA